MSALCILICRRDDPASATLTELASFDLPSPDLSALTPATTLGVGLPAAPRVALQLRRPPAGLADPGARGALGHHHSHAG